MFNFCAAVTVSSIREKGENRRKIASTVEQARNNAPDPRLFNLYAQFEKLPV